MASYRGAASRVAKASRGLCYRPGGYGAEPYARPPRSAVPSSSAGSTCNRLQERAASAAAADVNGGHVIILTPTQLRREQRRLAKVGLQGRLRAAYRRVESLESTHDVPRTYASELPGGLASSCSDHEAADAASTHLLSATCSYLTAALVEVMRVVHTHSATANVVIPDGSFAEGYGSSSSVHHETADIPFAVVASNAGGVESSSSELHETADLASAHPGRENATSSTVGRASEDDVCCSGVFDEMANPQLTEFVVPEYTNLMGKHVSYSHTPCIEFVLNSNFSLETEPVGKTSVGDEAPGHLNYSDDGLLVHVDESPSIIPASGTVECSSSSSRPEHNFMADTVFDLAEGGANTAVGLGTAFDQVQDGANTAFGHGETDVVPCVSGGEISMESGRRPTLGVSAAAPPQAAGTMYERIVAATADAARYDKNLRLTPLCPIGHGLGLLFSDGNWVCDICGSEILEHLMAGVNRDEAMQQPMRACKECDIAMCTKCAPLVRGEAERRIAAREAQVRTTQGECAVDDP